MTLAYDTVNARHWSAILHSMKRMGGRLLLVAIVGLAGMALVAWQFGPELGGMLPGQVRQQLPAPLLAVLSEPLPASLPAPGQVDSVAMDALLAVPSPTPLPPTAWPTAASSIALESTPVATQTGQPSPTAATTAEPEPTPLSEVTLPPATATVMAVSLPPERYLQGIDIVPQKFNNCGPANLSMVLDYHGIEHDQLAIAALVRPEYEDRNVTPQELVRYVTSETELAALVFHGGSLEQLRALLAAELPVIVEKGLQDDGRTGWMGHYLTLYGYDDSASHFFARDTFLGPWEEDGFESYDSLLRQWQQFNNVMVVVYPSEQADDVSDILGPGATDLVVMWADAVEQARAAVRANPQDAFGWFSLGTSLVGQAQLTDDSIAWQQAAASFDQARLFGLPPRMLWYQFAPYEAYLATDRPGEVVALAEATMATQGGRSVEETYLYLGHAWRAMGDENLAQEAYSQAIAISPHTPAARAAGDALASP